MTEIDYFMGCCLIDSNSAVFLALPLSYLFQLSSLSETNSSFIAQLSNIVHLDPTEQDSVETEHDEFCHLNQNSANAVWIDLIANPEGYTGFRGEPGELK